MRIIGLGVDLAEIERVRRLLERYPRFSERCFTVHERGYAFSHARPERRLAARFAGKEAVSKVLGTGFVGMAWSDIEILSDGRGKPTVSLFGRASRRAKDIGIQHIEISLSHSQEYAIAFAVGY